MTKEKDAIEELRKKLNAAMNKSNGNITSVIMKISQQLDDMIVVSLKSGSYNEDKENNK